MIHQCDVMVLRLGSSYARGERFGHHPVLVMRKAQRTAQFVHDDGQQVDAVLLALVAAQNELGVVPRRRIDEPARAGGVVVEAVSAVRSRRGQSSFRIVPTPRCLVNSELLLLPNRSR